LDKDDDVPFVDAADRDPNWE
ncbi:hypothetical protein NPIL_523811, partial [Nephila pilipes]